MLLLLANDDWLDRVGCEKLGGSSESDSASDGQVDAGMDELLDEERAEPGKPDRNSSEGSKRIEGGEDNGDELCGTDPRHSIESLTAKRRDRPLLCGVISDCANFLGSRAGS